jgi:enoyl-CoA hydratase/carnithine racemase
VSGTAPRVDVAVEDGVAVLTLVDVVRKNAMTEALGDAVRDAVLALRQRNDVRAVVVTGAGEAFSAGGDLAMLEQLRQASFAEARSHMLAFYARYLSLLDLDVPTIAAVRGPAIGAGLCVATACDLMVVADDATLAFNFVGLGLHPGMGASYFLPRRVGHQRAAELLFTGRRFTGRDAVAMGLALDAVTAEAVVGRAVGLARQIATQSGEAVRALCRTLEVDRTMLRAALEREASAQAGSYASDDLREGLAALRERRAPRFS